MYGLYIERRSINGKDLISWDLAQHIYSRYEHGKIIVATERPVELLSATRRQWFRLMRKVMRQRSSTLDATRSIELCHHITYMQTLRFSAKRPTDYLEADVTFATVDDLIRVTPICRVAYITHEVEKEKLHMLTSWMPNRGVVVVYERQHPVLVNNRRKEPKDGANARTADQKSYQTALH